MAIQIPLGTVTIADLVVSLERADGRPSHPQEPSDLEELIQVLAELHRGVDSGVLADRVQLVADDQLWGLFAGAGEFSPTEPPRFGLIKIADEEWCVIADIGELSGHPTLSVSDTDGNGSVYELAFQDATADDLTKWAAERIFTTTTREELLALGFVCLSE